MKHVYNEQEDMQITQIVIGEPDEDSRQVIFEGLNNDFTVHLREFDTLMQERGPVEILNVVLEEKKQALRGLRDFKEIDGLVSQAITLQRANPMPLYQEHRRIGKGGQGDVFLVTRKSDGKQFALKKVELVNNRPGLRQLIINEASLLNFFNCEQLVRCVDIFEYSNYIWMFIDYMDLSSQEKIIIKSRNGKNHYSEKFCQHTLYQVALGLHAMHSQDVLHRDIKSDNILSSSDGRVKLADLGFSKYLTNEEQQRKTKRGTTHWMSPEIHNRQLYGKEIDVWSYGCYAFELATGYPPFHSLRGWQLYQAIRNDYHGAIDRARFSAEFQDFIDQCLRKDASQRPTISQLLRHSFLAKMNPTDCEQAFKLEYTAFQNKPK